MRLPGRAHKETFVTRITVGCVWGGPVSGGGGGGVRGAIR